MQGYRFYAEYTDKPGGTPAGTVVAIQPETGRRFQLVGYNEYIYDGVAGVFSSPNTPVASCSISQKYLDTTCREVTEAEARGIHPALFQFLDGN